MQLDLLKSEPRSSKCTIFCHKGPQIGPDGRFNGMAKAGKMKVLPGYTVNTFLGKMEASGLLHYEFVTSPDGKGLGQRWWMNGVVKGFHEIGVFPHPSQCEETWKQAYEIRAALEEVWADDNMPLVTSYPSRMSRGIFYKRDDMWTRSPLEALDRRRIDITAQLLNQRCDEIDALLEAYNSIECSPS
ncbi:hypothetical protein PISL3812_03365 [Talaromyces islandicus]|uniref:Uncharacterized protein n=1 Tax=Talaromyces islandicus TaxID=28573 RepID=A0A0U1LUW0_TALIS|nr:hypothetical protein PISL3812_03365 [Talaromyces islandicus]